jgi:hypothetical protein
MRRFAWVGLSVMAIVGLSHIPSQLQAVQLRDGKTYFTQPPRLVNAVPTFSRAEMPGVTYYFTLSLPENAGEPLQRITIAQNSGGSYPKFGLRDSEAFEGTHRRPGAKISLGEVTEDRENRVVSVVFDPPVNPGKTVTIALAPVRNPDMKGTYLFGVTAFPVGDNPNGQFLGFGRFQIRRVRGT